MELLRSDGRLVSGLPCIYHLGLAVLYSAPGDVKEDADSYVFDPEKTVCLLFQPPQANGTQGVAFMKGFGPAIPLKPSYLRAGKSAVFITDCTDPNIIKLAKQTLSGLVIAGPGAAMPSGEKVH